MKGTERFCGLRSVFVSLAGTRRFLLVEAEGKSGPLRESGVACRRGGSHGDSTDKVTQAGAAAQRHLGEAQTQGKGTRKSGYKLLIGVGTLLTVCRVPVCVCVCFWNSHLSSIVVFKHCSLGFNGIVRCHSIRISPKMNWGWGV